MSAKCATLRETFLANFTFVGPLAGVSPSMFDQILPIAERLPAKLADLRFLAGVYSNMNLHVLAPDQLPADLASHLALAGVGPQVFLVTIIVERLETADLAFVLFPGLRSAVNFHVTSQVDAIPERFVTDLAGAGLDVAVHAHVSLEGRLQVKSLVADLAELRELFVVPSDVDLQVITGRQFRAADVAYVWRAVQRFVHVQVFLFLENFMADVALDRFGLLLPFVRARGALVLRFFLDPFGGYGVLVAPCPSMLEQLHFLRERFAAHIARIFLIGFTQRLARTKYRLLGSVDQ